MTVATCEALSAAPNRRTLPRSETTAGRTATVTSTWTATRPSIRRRPPVVRAKPPANNSRQPTFVDALSDGATPDRTDSHGIEAAAGGSGRRPPRGGPQVISHRWRPDGPVPSVLDSSRECPGPFRRRPRPGAEVHPEPGDGGRQRVSA